MGRQIKKNPEVEALQQKNCGPNMSMPDESLLLEDITEEEAFGIEIDEEEKQVLIVIGYRKKFGDPFDEDIEHEFTPIAAKQLALALVNAAEEVEKMMGSAPETISETGNVTDVTDTEVKDGNPDV